MEILIVMLWSKDSNFSVWPGSHRCWLSPVKAANSLLEVPYARLRQLDLEAQEQTFQKGGLSVALPLWHLNSNIYDSTVHDARVAFQIHRGIALTYAFGTRLAIENWTPMKLPKSLEDTIHEIETATIGINVTYFGGLREQAA